MSKFNEANVTDNAQKPKFKVGKAKPKPSNFTDTSFKAKGAHPLLIVNEIMD